MKESMNRRDNICLAWFFVAFAGAATMFFSSFRPDVKMNFAIAGWAILVVGLALHLLYQEDEPITPLRAAKFLVLTAVGITFTIAVLIQFGIVVTQDDLNSKEKVFLTLTASQFMEYTFIGLSFFVALVLLYFISDDYIRSRQRKYK